MLPLGFVSEYRVEFIVIDFTITTGSKLSRDMTIYMSRHALHFYYSLRLELSLILPYYRNGNCTSFIHFIQSVFPPAKQHFCVNFFKEPVLKRKKKSSNI